MAYDIVIVGAGHGGAQAALQLRQTGFSGTIAMIGEEKDPPYERPPLSKEYMAGDKQFDRLLIRPLSFWKDRGIDLLLGRRVRKIDAIGKTVSIGMEEEQIGYDKLIWAAGGTPRPLTCPGATARGVFSIRRRADVDAIMQHLPSVKQVVVIGGGYIGLEAAAVLRKAGKAVVLLEAQTRILARVAGEELSHFYEEEHRRQGVDLRFSKTIERITEDNGVATGVVLSDGTIIAAELIIVGIGIVPETGPLIAAGATGGNGVDVDAYCRTSLPDIYAIGDCACHANPFARGQAIRLESVQNANDQAKTAAQHIVGDAQEYTVVPWFWSNQYDLKLQTVGLSTGHDQTIVRGSPEQRSFSVLYLLDKKLIALDCVNAVKDYVQGKAHILSGVVLDQAQLADPSHPLKEVSLA